MNASPARSHRRTALGVLSLAVSLGLVVWLVARIDLARARSLVLGADAATLALVVGLTLLLPITSALRWLGVLNAQHGPRVPFVVALRAVMIALVLNSFLPSKAGDLSKAFYLRRTVGLSAGLGSVVLERMIDVMIIGLLGILGATVSGVRWGLWGGLTLVAIILSMLGFLLFAPVERLPLPAKLESAATSFVTVSRMWIRHPACIAQTLAASVATWGIACGCLWLVARALRAQIEWAVVASVFPLAVMAGWIPVTLSGIGTRDAAIAHLLHGHLTLEQATLVAFGYTLCNYWLLSLLCFPAVAGEIKAWWAARSATQPDRSS